jgi:hypothetical protein
MSTKLRRSGIWKKHFVVGLLVMSQCHIFIHHCFSSAAIVQDLKASDGASGRYCAHHFFDATGSKAEQSLEGLLRSLVCQLASFFDEVPAHLLTLHRLCNRGIEQPSIDAMISQLLQLIENCKHRVFIAIDALDEASESVKVVHLIEKLCNYKNLCVLLTSRNELPYKTSTTLLNICLTNVPLRDEDLKQDIQQFLDDAFRSEELEDMEPSERNQVKGSLEKRVTEDIS